MWTVLFSFQAAISQASSLTSSVLLESISRAASLPENLPEVNVGGGVGIGFTSRLAAAEPTRARAAARAS
jgi:hypothetical protein